jgi:hypothetical protein
MASEVPPPRSELRPQAVAANAGSAVGVRSAVAMPRASGNAATESSIPPELLARSNELEKEMLGSEGDPDEDHFHQIFNEFVEARRRCEEPVDGLTYDRFIVRLRKNRDQLMEKYNCKSVRFQVYVKDGKAAVKALPVR